MNCRKAVGIVGVVVGGLVAAAPLAAQGGYVGTSSFGFDGSVTRYSTLADAQNQTNAVGLAAAFPQRDLTLYFADHNGAFTGAGYPPSDAYFMNYWYANGGNTPSNSSYGLIQLNDLDGGEVTSMSTSFDAPRTTFTFAASGGGSTVGCEATGTPDGDCGRLWNGVTGAGAVSSGGSFVNWSVGFTATGLAPATFNAITGVWESASQPTGVNGFMNGIFQNTSGADAGFYTYDLSMNMDSWATENGYTEASAFGSPTTTPEPSSIALLGTGLFGLVPMIRRRRRK